MADVPASVENALAANRGKNYCADCLAQAAGLALAEQVTSLARLMRIGYRQASDRVADKGVCAICGRTENIVRLRG
jgi:hypothetical protein